MFKSSIRAMAAAGAAAIAIGTVLAQKADASNCKTYDWGTGCMERVNGSIDRIGFQWNSGDWFVGEVTCLSGRWVLHSGWSGSISRTLAGEVTQGYCQGRGPHM